MTGAARVGATKLYTPRLLSLAADLADYPLDATFQQTAETRSRTCGSTLEIGIDCDAEGRVERLGMMVMACAVGQASAAILARQAEGRPSQDFAATLTAVQAWLAGESAAPDWPGIDALEPALAHTGRHGALLLPWKAAAQALSSPGSTR